MSHVYLYLRPTMSDRVRFRLLLRRDGQVYHASLADKSPEKRVFASCTFVRSCNPTSVSGRGGAERAMEILAEAVSAARIAGRCGSLRQKLTVLSNEPPKFVEETISGGTDSDM